MASSGQPDNTASAVAGNDAGADKVDEAMSLEKVVSSFRYQYDKAYRQLKVSMEREKRLIQKINDVKFQLVDNARRLDIALKAKQHDENVIRTLRAELRAALQAASLSKQREKRALNLVSDLRNEVEALTKHAHAAFSTHEVEAHSEAPLLPSSSSASARSQSRTNSRPSTASPMTPSGRRASLQRSTVRGAHPAVQGGDTVGTLAPLLDFATWKKINKITHDHKPNKGSRSDFNRRVKARRTPMHSPLRMAEIRAAKR